LFVVVALAAGCGSVAVDDLFDGGGSSEGGTTGDGAPGTNDDAGPARDGSTDAGVPAEGGGGADAGPTRPIHCPAGSGLACQAGAQACCRVNGTSFSCTARLACAGNTSLSINCDDPTDCTGLGGKGVCCGSRELDGSVFDVSCALPVDCIAASHTTLCDPTAPNPCTNGDKCILSQDALPGFYLCTKA